MEFLSSRFLNGKRLVRDRALETWRVPGREHQVRPVRDKNELDQLLRLKLREEVEEVLSATNVKEMIEEIADVMTVLAGIADSNGIDTDQIEDAYDEKMSKSGGFFQGMVWDTNI